jgi:rare lipoprotein A
MLKQFCLGGVVVAAICALFAGSASAQCGKASWYGAKGLVAAHRTLPIGSHVKVTNKRNGHMVVVRITNRGPFVRGRIIDVSRLAAKELGIVGSGVGHVCVAAS